MIYYFWRKGKWLDVVKMKLSRREFIISSGLATCALGLAPPRLWAKEDEYWLREAMHYGVQEGGVVNCMLCP